MQDKIEVFQDLKIPCPVSTRSNLKDAFTDYAGGVWSVDADRTSRITLSATRTEDVVIFVRDSDSDHPETSLTLWGDDDGYYVPNIVPVSMGELTIAQYNSILRDFIKEIAKPAAARCALEIIVTPPNQSIDDWMSPDAAKNLRQFSANANKSTGTGHPLDQRRWFEFVISAHRSEESVNARYLCRWLIEVDGWSDKSAQNLTDNFETEIALLAYYDEH